MKKLMFLLFVAVCASSLSYGMIKEEFDISKLTTNKSLTETHLKNLQLFLEIAKDKNLANVDSYYSELNDYSSKYLKDEKSKNFLDKLFSQKWDNSEDVLTSIVITKLYNTFSNKQDVIFFNDYRLKNLDIFFSNFFNKNKEEKNTIINDDTNDNVKTLNDIPLFKEENQKKKTGISIPKRLGLLSFFVNLAISAVAEHYKLSPKVQIGLFGLSTLGMGIYKFKEYKKVAKKNDNPCAKRTIFHGTDILLGGIGFLGGKFGTAKIKNYLAHRKGTSLATL